MPEKIFVNLKKNVLPQWRACFYSALIFGFIAHLYKLTNWLPNWDSLVFRYDSQNMLTMGRWFLPVASAPSSYYDLPWLAGLLAIIFFALGGVVICQIFDVKKNTTAILIGASIISFPTVTSVLLYNYVADSYAISFFLATLAAFFMTKTKPNYLVAALLIAFSVGIYQAFLTVTIMLLLLFLVLAAFREDENFKTLFFKCIKFLLTGALGMIIYLLILNLLLKVSGTVLIDYQGISEAGSLSGMDLLGSLYTVKETFVEFFFDFSNGISCFNLVNIVIFAFTVIFYICEIIRSKIKISKLPFLCLFVLLLPIGAAILSFANSGVDYHNLMRMGYFVFYLFFILQYEKTDSRLTTENVIKSWVILSVTAVLIFTQVIISNVSYHKLTMSYEKSYGTLIRIADRIEQTEGAENCSRILVLGSLEDSSDYSVVLPPEITGTTDGYILRADDEIVGQSVMCSALNDYCGKNYEFLFGTEKEELIKQIESEEICVWPDHNSVFVIDDVIVLSLGSWGSV